MSEERSLADLADNPVPEAETSLVDTTVTPVPEDFDLDAWLDGVRPQRRSVKLYPQADLVARMEEIADKIDNTPSYEESEELDALIDEFDQLKAQFKDGVWFTVEQRSTEWVENFRKRLAKTHNLKDDPAKDAELISTYQIAEQIIQPQGVTFNHLRKLQAANEAEYVKLITATQLVNQMLAEKAGVLDRDFSGRRSASTED